MANTVRENEIDVAEIREKLTPQHVQDALEGVQDAQRALMGLRKGYAHGTSPELVRALDVVERALDEALE